MRARGLAVGFLISTLQALLLWLFLPRGVVLTRTPLADVRAATYGSVEDRWYLRNDSAIPARILSVTLVTPSGSHPVEPAEGGPLALDDGSAEMRRTDRRIPWSEITVPPGDGLVAHVGTNQTLEIEYRRAGWAGVLERRRIRVSGGV